LWPKAHFEHVCLKTTQTASFEVFPSDKLELKQQRKHNLSTKVTFIQYLTYIKVISIDDLFVYTTNGAFYEGKSSSLLARPTFREKAFRMLSTCQSSALDQSASENLLEFCKKWWCLIKIAEFYRTML